MHKQRGFTLVEVMVIVGIIAILAAIAVPTYDAQKRKGYRTDAVRALTESAQLQERWYSNNGTYATLDNIYGTTFDTSANGQYAINASYSAVHFTITATAQGNQLDDKKCRTFTIDHVGRKTSTDDSAAASTGCWPK